MSVARTPFDGGDTGAIPGQVVPGDVGRRWVTVQRLEYWTKRLGAGPAEVAFVPVTLPTTSSAAIEIGVGDIVVRVRDGHDIERVARLVVAIARGRAC